MNNDSFVFYASFYKQIEILEKRLGKETAYDFLKAVIEFGLFGALPEEDSEVMLYGFEQTIASIGAAKKRWEAAKENGKKGGRPKMIDDKKVLELRAAGMTLQSIADQVGCSVSSVEKIVAADRKNQKNHIKTLTNPNVNVNVNGNVNVEGFEAESLKDCGAGTYEGPGAEYFNF